MTPSGLLGLLEWVSDEVGHPELQLSTLRTFLFVATRGTCGQKDVEQHLKATQGSTSRNVAFWTEKRFDREPGMGFIRREEDDNDRRSKKLSLTSKGDEFYNRLKEKL